MNVQFHELTSTDACVAKRGFNYELTEAVSPYVKKAGIVKAAIAEYYKGLKEEGLEKYLQESFADLEYVSNQQREYHVKDALRQILRYVHAEDLDYRNFDTSMATCMGALAIAKLVFQIVKAGQYSVSDAESVLEKMDNKARFTSKKAVEQLIALYDEYDDKLKKENLIEFSDQEVLLFELLHRNPFYMERFGFKHVIVDEFQDSSAGQIELIKKIIETPTFQSLMVVGDDSQAIFSFRDTTPEYILNFASIIGRPVDDIMLMENHRSTPEVLNAANNINNLRSDRVKKDLIATRTSGKPVVVKGFLTKVEEKDYVIKQIKEYLLDGVKAEDIAIIAATKYELMDMADKLSQEDIQTVMLNPEPLMENSRVVAALALCTAINVPDDTKDMLTYANARMTKHNLLDAPRTVIEYVLERIAQEIEAFHNLTEEEKKKFCFVVLKILQKTSTI